jgi:hypothetical protein
MSHLRQGVHAALYPACPPQVPRGGGARVQGLREKAQDGQESQVPHDVAHWGTAFAVSGVLAEIMTERLLQNSS